MCSPIQPAPTTKAIYPTRQIITTSFPDATNPSNTTARLPTIIVAAITTAGTVAVLLILLCILLTVFAIVKVQYRNEKKTKDEKRMEVSSARNPQQNDEAETTSGDGVNESYGLAITVQRNLAYMEDTGVCINTYLPHIQIVEFFFFFFLQDDSYEEMSDQYYY